MKNFLKSSVDFFKNTKEELGLVEIGDTLTGKNTEEQAQLLSNLFPTNNQQALEADQPSPEESEQEGVLLRSDENLRKIYAHVKDLDVACKLLKDIDNQIRFLYKDSSNITTFYAQADAVSFTLVKNAIVEGILYLIKELEKEGFQYKSPYAIDLTVQEVSC